MPTRVSAPEAKIDDVPAGLAPESREEARAARRRLAIAYVAPGIALLTVFVLPLLFGGQTLHLRDVFGTHLEMKWFQAEAMREGYLPLIDPHRAGGQAHLGNPNTVALYPTNLLFLVGDFFWAFNAHFWLHLLIAPFSFYTLARAWRLERAAAWFGGVAFAASGYLLSHLNLYNLIAPVALTPAFVAACIRLSEGTSRGRQFAAAALLWALILLGGDPITAAMALLLALGAVASAPGLPRIGEWRGRWREGRSVLAAIALGTVVALPQLVEFARILRHSFRGFWGFSGEAAMVASFRPTAAIEWFLPLFFGWPNLGFWGGEIYGGNMPLLFSLAPGVIVLALVLASGRPRRNAALWAWAAVLLGLFVALGDSNPLLVLLLELPGASLFRLPIKFWLLVAVGGSLLAALGFERLLFGKGRLFGRVIALLALAYGAVWLSLARGGSIVTDWARERVPGVWGGGYLDQERLRWAGVAFVTLLVLAATLGVLRLARRRPALLALLPILHLVSQIFFLRPLVPTDEVGPYLERPELLSAVPAGGSVVHGNRNGLFGETPLPLDRYPDLRVLWMQRQMHRELYPQAGVRFGLRYELDPSPEGLDAFLSRAASQAVKILPDPARVRLLRASGVEGLIVGRRLDELERVGAVEAVASAESVGGRIYLYRIVGRVERARIVSEIVRSPHLNAVLDTITSATFDPRRTTTLPAPDGFEVDAGSAQGIDGSAEVDSALDDGAGPSAGSVRWVEDRPESMTLEVEAPGGGALVVQRTPLPILRAEVDGVATPIVPADLHRIGIELEPGDHTVRIWADRTPLRVSLALSVLGLLATLGVARRLAIAEGWRARGPAGHRRIPC